MEWRFLKLHANEPKFNMYNEVLFGFCFSLLPVLRCSVPMLFPVVYTTKCFMFGLALLFVNVFLLSF